MARMKKLRSGGVILTPPSEPGVKLISKPFPFEMRSVTRLPRPEYPVRRLLSLDRRERLASRARSRFSHRPNLLARILKALGL